MDIVEFLEARIAEEESALLHADTGDPPATSLVRQLLAECAQKRAILEGWALRSEAAGIRSPAQSSSSLTAASSAMLSILAAAYSNHPDYPGDWRAACPITAPLSEDSEETPPH